MFCKIGILLLFTFSLIQCEVYRLPKHVKPKRYFLTMEPFLTASNLWDDETYNGSVIIEFQVLETTKQITLNQKYLRIVQDSIKISGADGKEVKAIHMLNDDNKEFSTIDFENELIKDQSYNLTIGEFSGNLGNGEGFFRGFYTTNATLRRLAATHFEPTGARRAFPCFDEPSLKATFIVSLIRTAEYNSVSSEELDKTETLTNGRFKDTFKETPVMSTFILAFAVTDFKISEKLERHRILARPSAIENGDWKYALGISVTTLKALEEFTGIDFVIPKMDQIAIPDGYFHEHAMENWGLVVYGESHLLRPNSSKPDAIKRTTCYVAHEFAHQWFGNLVTPSWWDHLWISESFAAYFQYYIASKVQPTWRLMDQFVIDIVHVSLKREEERGAHPLTYEIKYSGQYPPFHIMYEKGSTTLRMMEHFLTHDVYRRGLQIYLQNNKFTATEPVDLYKALQEAVDSAGVNNLLHNHTVAEIMSTWEHNPGFPLITVTRNYETGNFTIEQSSKFNNESKWIVPINYVFSSGGKIDFTQTTADLWLKNESVTLQGDFPTDGWLVINKQQTGYYRVNYDLENWERIIRYLNSENYTLIHPLTRAQLINDAFYLAQEKTLSYDIPLRLSEYIIREKDFIPLFSFYYSLTETVFVFDYTQYGDTSVREFQYFNNYTSNFVTTEDTTEYNVYKQYVRTLLAPVNVTIGLEAKEGDTFLDQLHRQRFRQLFFEYFYVPEA